MLSLHRGYGMNQIRGEENRNGKDCGIYSYGRPGKTAYAGTDSPRAYRKI